MGGAGGARGCGDGARRASACRGRLRLADELVVEHRLAVRAADRDDLVALAQDVSGRSGVATPSRTTANSEQPSGIAMSPAPGRSPASPPGGGPR